MNSAKAMLDALVRRTGIAALLVGVLLGTLPAARANYVTNVLGHTWYFTVSTNGEATIFNGSGSAVYCAVSPQPDGLLTLPSSLDGYPVTGLGSGAFLNCTNLTGIVIPSGLRTITSYGYSPVAGCPKFENVCVHDVAAWCDMSFNKLDGGLGVFGCLWRLRTRNPPPADESWAETGHLVIPEGVERVASNAFWGCTSLRSVTFPRSLKRIEAAAFRDCPNLTNLVFRSESLEIQREAFYGCTNLPAELVIPDGVTQIGAWAFYGCSNLVKVSIAASVTNIDTSTGSWGRPSYSPFAGCPSIVEVAFPPCAKASALFPEAYTNIVKAAVSPGAASVGDGMFNGCAALEEVAIPDTVASIGSQAFRACTSLEEIDVPAGTASIGSYACYGCTNLARIDLPEGVKTIGQCAFSGCSRMDGAVLRPGLETIESSAFSGCTGLAEIDIPDGTTDIGANAFNSCTGLVRVLIPGSVTNIYVSNIPSAGIYGAFSGCPSITEATIPAVETVSAVFPASYTNIVKIAEVGPGKNLPAGMFSSCSRLAEVSLSSAVETLNDGTFRGCVSLEEVELPAGLKSIGNQAFYGCTNLARADIPAGVTEIGSSAFYSCARLTHVDLPAGLTSIADSAFYGCRGITELDIPDGVTGIGWSAFAGCTGLTRVLIPGSVANIALNDTGRPYAAFNNCPAITEAEIPMVAPVRDVFPASYTNIVRVTGVGTATNLPASMFSSCSRLREVSIPATVESLGYSVFGYCVSLEEVELPAGLKSIGNQAFSGCTNLARADIPAGVTEIGSSAFYSCARLTHVDLPAGLTSIAYGAFFGCRGITELNIPNGVTSIGRSAFEGCTGLTRVSLPGSVTDIALNSTGYYQAAFNNCPAITEAEIPMVAPVRDVFPASYTNIVRITGVGTATNLPDSMFSSCSRLREVSIPATVESLGKSAFYYCVSLEEIELPEKLKSIAPHAFYGCTNLVRADIPAGVTEIGSSAFYSCARLPHVDLPAGVTSIADSVFYGCRGLTELDIPDGVTGIGRNAFAGCTGLTRVSIPESVTDIALNSTGQFYDAAFYNCPGITEVAMPMIAPVRDVFPASNTNIVRITGVGRATNLPDSMFSSCSRLREVSIPATVESLGKSAFYYCVSLDEVELPAGLKSIGNQAFFGCTNLARADIPVGVTEIGASAFSSCARLTDVMFSGNAPACGTNIYSGTPTNLTSWVKQGSTGWDGTETGTALPETWNGRPIRRWGAEQYEAAGEEVPTATTETGNVPEVWLDEYDLARDGDYEAAAEGAAANGQPVWECYVAGLDPTAADAKFRTTLRFDDDGSPIVEWVPDLNEGGTKAERRYIVEGQPSMGDKWEDRNPDSRFFRVRVEMPEK